MSFHCLVSLTAKTVNNTTLREYTSIEPLREILIKAGYVRLAYTVGGDYRQSAWIIFTRRTIHRKTAAELTGWYMNKIETQSTGRHNSR